MIISATTTGTRTRRAWRQASAKGHPITVGLGGKWPALLGYNRVRAKPDADVVAVPATIR